MADLHALWDETGAEEDEALVQAAVRGQRSALTTLVERHQPFLYHVALRLVLAPADAEDLAQEALLRILTHLSQYAGKARFRTWAYRILVNCFRQRKRRKMESSITSFTAFGEELDELPSAPLHLPAPLEPDRALLVEETKVGCMIGMLMCLDREQRLTYVLGDALGVPSPLAAEILEVSPATFRKRLERARRDLRTFMHDKCGLMNEANPCRCERKTRAFIEKGWVDPARRRFTPRRVDEARAQARDRLRVVASAAHTRDVELYRSHPRVESPNFAQRIRELLDDPELRRGLDLADPAP
ncbi:MAG: RNA polymerase sigma factor [Myxococcota bacterium]